MNKISKIYIVESTYEMIHKAMKEKSLSYEDVAKEIGVSPTTVYRICVGETKSINTYIAQKLETVLDISITNAFDDTRDLIKRIEELERENKILKSLLTDKWRQ